MKLSILVCGLEMEGEELGVLGNLNVTVMGFEIQKCSIRLVSALKFLTVFYTGAHNSLVEPGGKITFKILP